MDLTDDKDAGSGDILAEAKERYKTAEEAWADNIKAYIADTKFRAGDHWPEKIKKQREDKGRATLVVDKINQYIRQVVNDGRQNRPSVKVRPVDDGGDEKVADAFQGVIRHICDQSNADIAFDTALDCAASGGFGFFRVLADYAKDDGFDKELYVKRIRNATGVLLDPGFQEADASDMRYAFVTDEFTKEEFKKRWPKAKATDWVENAAKFGEGWLTDKNVRVCEYWYTEDEDGETFHQLADGTSISDDDYQAIAKKMTGSPPEILDSRVGKSTKIKWCRLTGAEILEENEWLGKYIPIIPVFGNEYDLNGKVIYSGLVRAAMDAQRLYNYSRSAYAERVALTPKAPYVAAAGQVEGFPEWEDANEESYSVLPYNPVDVGGTALPAPQRQQASDIPEGFARDMQLAEHDIQASMGMYNSSIGEKSNEKSGKAIMARQREGDTATFHYQDNLNRAIRFLGRILVDLIPKYYGSRKVIRILGEDGESVGASTDPNQEQPVDQVGGMTVYNLNAGTYDVSVAAGPSYTTKRQEALEAGMQLAQSVPQLWQLVGDIIVRNADWPGADDMADRMKTMLPPPIQQMLQAKEQGQDPKVIAAVAPIKQQLDQAQQQIQAAESGIAQRDQALQQAQGQIHQLTLESQQAKAQASVNAAQAQVDQYNAETERLKVQQEAAKTPEDKTALEQLRLQYEDSWKKLDAETKVLVATIAADTAKAGQAAQAQAKVDGQIASDAKASEQASQPQQQPQGPDTSQALAVAIEGFTAALAEFKKPRVATMRDGSQIRIE